jgi:short-subunit dehydrogenase
MQDRAALVTGASRGIGLILAESLAEEGYKLTLTARRAASLEAAATKLRTKGHEVTTVPANMADETAAIAIVRHHEQAYGRLDVLVNSAGIGIGADVTSHRTKDIDLQLAVNVRALVLIYRAATTMLRAAGAEHGSALVVNLASIIGKSGQPWLSVYSATKAAVISYTEAMNRELAATGVKSVAFCPGFVDTDMADFIKRKIAPEEMIRPSDIAEALRFVLRLSPSCIVPEIMFQRMGEMQLGA